jgi:hypothetical protein
MARPRKASVAHRKVLTNPGVQLRRELTVEVLEETRHHVFARPAGLSRIAHWVDAKECRSLEESAVVEGQCVGLKRRKQAREHPMKVRQAPPVPA